MLTDEFTSTNLPITLNLHLYSYKVVESNSESHQKGVEHNIEGQHSANLKSQLTPTKGQGHTDPRTQRTTDSWAQHLPFWLSEASWAPVCPSLWTVEFSAFFFP